SAQPVNEAILSHPLGTLASDHAGYLSFDLTAARERFTKILRDGTLVKPSFSFMVYPRGQDNLQLDVMQQARFTPDLIFGKLELEGAGDMEDHGRVNLPSMHDPGLDDWYLSPGSFAVNP